MKYIAILRQEGGCDYTIGCGINTIQFEADSPKEAAEKLQNIIKDNYNSDEHRLKQVNFYEIKNSYEVDVDLWYKKFDDEINAIQRKEQEKAEWAEYLRLKEKFGA